MSNFLLYVDHMVCKKGEAFTNHGGNFYETDTTWQGYNNYSAPFKQLVSDTSIPDAQIMSGVYIDGAYSDIGENGLHSINHMQGMVHSTSAGSTVSGNYSIKDFNVYLTNQSEEEILFETKFDLKPKVTQTLTGLHPATQTVPAIFIKSNGSRNEPFAYGGADKTITEARAIVLSDSSIKLDAVCSILRDMKFTTFPFIETALPFNAFGAYTGTLYNYTGLANPYKESGVWIDSAMASQNIGKRKGFKDLNSEIYSAFVDFDLWDVRNPRD